MKNKRTVKISIIVLIVLISSFFVAILRLGQIAMSSEVDGVDIAAFAKNRNETVKTLYASRGTIYDVNGETLAQSVNSYTVIAYLSSSRTSDINNPKHVVDKENTAHKLNEVFERNGITSMSYERIFNLLNKNAYQVELGPGGRGITEYLKSEIEELELPGIDFIQSTKRYYKMATLAPYIVGYAKENDEGKITGEMGIEKYYNDELTGVDGSSKYETDVYGYRLPNSNEERKEPKQGNDIYLTLDTNIQMFLEQAVQGLYDEYNASWLTFTVADAKTGAILGSASNPTFNLNKQNMTSYLNPLVSYQYEPGSTMKIYSWLASMENGLYDGSALFQSGQKKVGDATIHDFNDVGWGMISFDEGFARSANTGAATLAEKMGRDKLREFYDKAGFGKLTEIELPGEVEGNANFIYDTEVATAAYGQGITTTPIQNIQALTMIANDGVMLKPYIVSKIVDTNKNKTVYEGKRTEIGQVAKKESIDYIRKLMDDAIYLNLTDAKYYQPNNIRMIGKTGTANIPSPKGGYLEKEYVRSFAGLFPAENPQYVIYMSAKQFTGPFKKLAKAVTTVVEEIAKYKNIASIDTSYVNEEVVTLDNYISNNIEEVEEKLKTLKLNPVILGNGKYVINIYPKKGNKVLSGTKIFVKTSSSNYKMPNVVGWSENEIVTLCNFIGLKYNISGYGNVISQSIESNTIINLDDTLFIELG